MIRRELGLSIGALSTPQELRAMADAGISALELCFRRSVYESMDWAAFVRQVEQAGMRVNSVHLPFIPATNLACNNTEVRRGAVEIQKRLITEAARAKIPIAVIHPSNGQEKDPDRGVAAATSAECLAALTAFASDLGVTLAVENLPRSGVGYDVAEMKTLLAADPRLKLCFDVNHLLRCSHQDFLDAFGDRIGAVHISDYDFIDEKHWMPGEGDIDWIALTEGLDAVHYEGVFTYEVSLGAKTKVIERERPIAPQDIRDNYDALCAGLPTPVLPVIFKKSDTAEKK